MDSLIAFLYIAFLITVTCLLRRQSKKDREEWERIVRERREKEKYARLFVESQLRPLSKQTQQANIKALKPVANKTSDTHVMATLSTVVPAKSEITEQETSVVAAESVERKPEIPIIRKPRPKPPIGQLFCENEREHYLKRYGNVTWNKIATMCGMSEYSCVGEDGFPHSLKSPDEYTVYLSRTGRCYHRIRYCGGTLWTNTCNIVQVKEKKACSNCNPIGESRILWYRKFCDVVQRLYIFHIPLGGEFLPGTMFPEIVAMMPSSLSSLKSQIDKGLRERDMQVRKYDTAFYQEEVAFRITYANRYDDFKNVLLDTSEKLLNTSTQWIVALQGQEEGNKADAIKEWTEKFNGSLKRLEQRSRVRYYDLFRFNYDLYTWLFFLNAKLQELSEPEARRQS